MSFFQVSNLLNGHSGIHGRYIIRKDRGDIEVRHCRVKSFSNWSSHLVMDFTIHEGFYRAEDCPFEGFHFPKSPQTFVFMAFYDNDNSYPRNYEVSFTDDRIVIEDTQTDYGRVTIHFKSNVKTTENISRVSLRQGGLLPITRTCRFDFGK